MSGDEAIARSGGRLVKVGFARNQAEAELIQGMLRAEGIPSSERRARGFDVPDFLAAGPREILVPEQFEKAAREVLAGTSGNGRHVPPGPDRPLRLFGGLLLALAVGAVVIWVLFELAT